MVNHALTQSKPKSPLRHFTIRCHYQVKIGQTSKIASRLWSIGKRASHGGILYSKKISMEPYCLVIKMLLSNGKGANTEQAGKVLMHHGNGEDSVTRLKSNVFCTASVEYTKNPTAIPNNTPDNRCAITSSCRPKMKGNQLSARIEPKTDILSSERMDSLQE